MTHAEMIAKIRKYNNGTKFIIEDGACCYLSENGNRCAIGCFIPDDWIEKVHAYEVEKGYQPTADEIVAKFPELKKFMPSDDLGLLKDFQDVHDQWDEADGDLHKGLEDFIIHNF